MPLRSTVCLLAMLFICGTLLSTNVDAAKNKKKSSKKEDKAIAKCNVCKKITAAFHRGYKDTDNIHFTGESKGWTLDNEKFLGKYKMGEARLVEILEHACGQSDIPCLEMMEDVEGPIEEWWGNRDDEGFDIDGLEAHLCTDTIKVCCANGTYGSTCKPCPSEGDAICSGHGTCNGDGTRGGDGKCKCKPGWTGKMCSKCKKNYFLNATESTAEVDCVKCDRACAECTGAGPENCTACAEGFEKNKDGDGCVDVDECKSPGPSRQLNTTADGTNDAETAAEAPPCDVDHYCRNTPGSYSCEECHRACAEGTADADDVHPDDVGRRCNGAGMMNCVACKAGYERSSTGGCVDIDECNLPNPHVCETGKFCNNLEGSVNCILCDDECDETGCIGTGNVQNYCLACREGFKRATPNDDKSKCIDMDECHDYLCPGAQDCENTRGSYLCSCDGAWTKWVEREIDEHDDESEECFRPAYLPAPKAPNPYTDDLVALQVPLFNNAPNASKERGVLLVGQCKSNLKLIDVIFDTENSRFTDTPVVSYLRTTNECCGDLFGMDAVNVTHKGFTLAVWRIDSQSGWGQDLKVEWAVASSALQEAEEQAAVADDSRTDSDEEAREEL
eukprot:m.385584 g.385584  ORF g.385584 m.385584 type:complete len:617 (-) comp21010_c0_seq1:1493-3343(-)